LQFVSQLLLYTDITYVTEQ